MRIYFAHPIDTARPEVGQDSKLVLDLLLDVLGSQGNASISVYVPSGAFKLSYPGPDTSLSMHDCNWLIELNETALHNADVMVLLYYKGTESWGLPQELLLAERWGKRVLLLIRSIDEEQPRLPVYLVGRVAKGDIYHDTMDLASRIAADYEEKDNGREQRKD
jgi:hypothetical protein